MHKDQRPTRMFRIFAAVCGISTFLSAYAIAFAHERTLTLHAAGITTSNIALGR